MRVIDEFAKMDLGEEHIVPVVKELFPVLLNILQDSGTHAPSTRASTVNVFAEVLKVLEALKDEHPGSVREALAEICPPWLATFKQLLAGDLVQQAKGSWEVFKLYEAIFEVSMLALGPGSIIVSRSIFAMLIFRKVLTDLTENFPRAIASHLVDLMQVSLHILSNLYPFFYRHQIAFDADWPEPPSPTSDTGQQVNLDQLPIAVFEFLYAAANREKAIVFLRSERGPGFLGELIWYQIDYCQITAEDVSLSLPTHFWSTSFRWKRC